MAVGAELSVVILWRFWISTLPDSFFPSPPPKKKKTKSFPGGPMRAWLFCFGGHARRLPGFERRPGRILGPVRLSRSFGVALGKKKQKLGCLRTGVAEPGARPAPPSGSVVWMGRAPCGEASAKWRAWIGKGRSASRRVVRECRFVWREPFCWALRPADRRGFCLRPEPIKAKRSVSLEASLFAFAAALRVCVAARALFLPFGSQAEGPGLAKDFGRRGIALF